MAPAHRFGGENFGRRRVARPARRPYRARRRRCAGGRRIARDASLRHDADRANPGRCNRNAQWGRYPAAAAVGFAAGNSRRSCSRSGGARARDAVPARHRDRFCGLALRVVGRRSRRRFPRRASIGGYGRTAGRLRSSFSRRRRSAVMRATSGANARYAGASNSIWRPISSGAWSMSLTGSASTARPAKSPPCSRTSKASPR